jgi:hypothetical protein
LHVLGIAGLATGSAGDPFVFHEGLKLRKSKESSPGIIICSLYNGVYIHEFCIEIHFLPVNSKLKSILQLITHKLLFSIDIYTLVYDHISK